MKFLLPLSVATILCLFVLIQGETNSSESDSRPVYELKLSSEVEWGALNPARGELGPRAANLWGNRSGLKPTGFLVKFIDGFSSPPHIHNVTYRGMVISGLVHNDDPAATNMWMPTGSFWTQPAGEVHITSAKGEENIAYIEIDAGPYLVLPAEEASDNGERPINVHPSNLTWLDHSHSTWIEPGDGEPEPQIAFLWGSLQNGKTRGTLVKIPPGFTGTLQIPGGIFRAVVIEGQPNYSPNSNEEFELKPGSYFGSKGKAIRQIQNCGSTDSLVYVRSNGRFTVLP